MAEITFRPSANRRRHERRRRAEAALRVVLDRIAGSVAADWPAYPDGPALAEFIRDVLNRGEGG